MILTREPYSLAFDHLSGRGPCVVFCPGFNSTRHGNKAQALQSLCREHGYEYLRFDYGGHGESGGDFADGTITGWLADTLDVIDRVVINQQVLLVGSSMGGWISLRAALALPSRVCALLLIACAADMTRYYPERLAGLPVQTDEQGRLYYSVKNTYDDEDDYRIYQGLLNDGEQHRLLDAPIDLPIPVRLIHGDQDTTVEWSRSLNVFDRLTSTDVTLQLIKNGDHRLSKEQDLECIELSLIELLRSVQ